MNSATGTQRRFGLNLAFEIFQRSQSFHGMKKLETTGLFLSASGGKNMNDMFQENSLLMCGIVNCDLIFLVQLSQETGNSCNN